MAAITEIETKFNNRNHKKIFFFFENAQILLSSATLLKTKFEGVWMFLVERVIEI